MTYECIKKSLLIAISFLVFGILFSCKNSSESKGQSEEEFLITFEASPKSAGSIIATVDGIDIESGVTKVKKGKEVVFTLAIKQSDIHELDDWSGAVKDDANPLMAKLKVLQNATVKAKIKKIDPDLNLSSLRIHNRDIDISNVNNISMEVENFVKTLNSNNVVAMFTYGTKTVPEHINVTVDKNNLDEGENIVKLSVQAAKGKYKAWNDKEVKIIRKGADLPNAIPSEVKLEAIEVAIVSENKEVEKIESFKPLKDFNSAKAGPYETEEAKTAYIELKMKVAKPSGEDFSVEVVNTTTYLEPVSFSRNTEGDVNYFAQKRITLSKGHNILKIKVKSPDNSKEGEYTVVIYYDGGQDPVALKMQDRKMIPGIYCPAQRKPLKGENPDLVWMIVIASWCGYCPYSLQAAGSNGRDIANKYKDKGLRVIAIDGDSNTKEKKEINVKKWKNAGANFALYTKEGCCFSSFYDSSKGYPYNVCIKEWGKTEIRVDPNSLDKTEEDIKKVFGF